MLNTIVLLKEQVFYLDKGEREDTRNAMKIPEQGQMVSVRNRYFVVNDVEPFDSTDNEIILHKVSLECLDDDMMGEEMELIWELELEKNKRVIDTIEFPKPERNKFDNWETFRAFINAINWSKSSLVLSDQFLSPYRAAIMLRDYQLEPLARAISMPRANLLIADDVGLGKTIEAGLVIQEFLAQQRIKRILIVCPAPLQKQWQDEMNEKFNLKFEIINREAILRLRREYGMHMNPWNFYPRLITSMDFLKRERPKQYFLESLKSKRKGFSLRDWDMLVLDEAHNVAPSGKKNYIRDSDRTKMALDIVNHFEHRLFLTATPHNGFTPSFTALLEMLDPLKFSRSDKLEKKYLERVMVRRLKDELQDELGRKQFKERFVESIDIEMDSQESELFGLLNRYIKSRINRFRDNKSRFAITFALTILKKRLLSSPLAFHKSINVHIDGLKTDKEDRDDSYVKYLQKKTLDEWVDDEEKAAKEDEALRESSSYFTDLTSEERQWLDSMQEIAKARADNKDSKEEALVSWIKEHLFANGKWSNERLLVFTEYRDTLEYLENMFQRLGWSDQYLTLMGGMRETERERIKAAFQQDPRENSTRVLLATDAASEGLNLQNHCRYLVHYEIPWNPNRMEQRNGRIDRVGQTRDVTVHHFSYKNHEDSEYLDTLVRKVKQMREDLGSVGEIISKRVEDNMLGIQKDRELILDSSIEKKIQLVREENKSERMTREQVRKLRLKREKTGKTLDIRPENVRSVLATALGLSGGSLEEITSGPFAGKGCRIGTLPNEWRHMREHLYSEGKKLILVFDHKDDTEKNTVLVHLNHPLIKKATNIFREHIWKTDLTGDSKVNRCSYKVVGDSIASKLNMMVFGRLVATNTKGIKIHEDLVLCGGEVAQSEVIPGEHSSLWGLFKSQGSYPEIPTEFGNQLRALFPSHEQAIKGIFDEIKARKKAEFKERLQRKAENEAKYIQELMQERMNEIQMRKEKMTREKGYIQTTLFDFTDEEKEQWEEDIRRLEMKFRQLESQIKDEPRKAKERYELKNFEIYPLATLYVIPEQLIQGWSDA